MHVPPFPVLHSLFWFLVLATVLRVFSHTLQPPVQLGSLPPLSCGLLVKILCCPQLIVEIPNRRTHVRGKRRIWFGFMCRFWKTDLELIRNRSHSHPEFTLTQKTYYLDAGSRPQLSGIIPLLFRMYYDLCLIMSRIKLYNFRKGSTSPI